MNKISALLAIAALAVPLAACGSSSKSSSSTGSTAAASNSGGSGSSKSSKTTVANSSASAQSGVVKMTMVDDAFQPKAITGKAGSTVKVELKNTGKNEHNFKISSQKQADADVPPGKSATVSVKIPASGSVQFFCEYHKGLGMVGTVKAS
jgi:plastocyanin